MSHFKENSLAQPTMGCFVELEQGHEFEYRETLDSWALGNGFNYEISVDTTTRFARILKDTAFICIEKDLIAEWGIKHIWTNILDFVP